MFIFSGNYILRLQGELIGSMCTYICVHTSSSKTFIGYHSSETKCLNNEDLISPSKHILKKLMPVVSSRLEAYGFNLL